MTPFTLPDSVKPRNLTSAPTMEVFKVGDLLPGLKDIPYIKGAFVVEGDGKSGLYDACCTFWEPDTEERAVIAAGGALQILTFGPRPAVQAISAAVVDGEIPETPVLTGVARYLYEKVHRASWDAASVAAQDNWTKLAQGCHDIFIHWMKETGGR